VPPYRQSLKIAALMVHKRVKDNFNIIPSSTPSVFTRVINLIGIIK
jgi:hypothetical protein